MQHGFQSDHFTGKQLKFVTLSWICVVSMPSEKMDKGRSPLGPSGKILEEYYLPHKQLGLRKPQSIADSSGAERTPIMLEKRSIGLSATSWKDGNQDFSRGTDLCVDPPSRFVHGDRVGLNGIYNENSLFSSSFPDIFKNKLELSPKNVSVGQSDNMANRNIGKEKHLGSLEESEVHSIADLLPDNDDLLSGVFDDPEYVTQPHAVDDIDDDIFCNGGGMELEADNSCISDKTSDSINGVVLHSLYANGHPYGEHPSRTLFVRNINTDVEDTELKTLFEQYGDIRTLYTDCKHQGFVMISYYDIRAARNAMRALQDKPLRNRMLDIHFCIPKDNPSEKDSNQGTLVIFNLDSSISHDAIRQMFGVYGAIKQIRETPNKHHHKFIEFYDVRSAEAALRALNRSDIGGKKIKLEPSRPGGVNRCSTQQISPELELEESSGCRQGIPSNSSPGCYGSVQLGSLNSSGAVLVPHSSNQMPVRPFMETAFPGISSREQNNLLGHSDLSHSLGHAKFGYQHIPNYLPHSLPEYHDGFQYGLYNSSTKSAMGINCQPSEGIDTRYMNKVGSSSLNSDSFEHSEIAFGAQYPSTYYHHPRGPVMWPGSPAFINTMPSYPLQQVHGLQGAPPQIMNAVRPLQCHSLRSEIISDPLYWHLQRTFLDDSTDSPALRPHSLGSKELSGNCPVHRQELGSRNSLHARGENKDPTHFGSPKPRQKIFFSRKPDKSHDQADNGQNGLDLERISRGEDPRTTIMIKNIPNKYTAKMLLAVIDELYKGTYDFFYLPIDFKNKCNVGYAFINMIDPQQIIPFYQVFHGKKWEKFNSEKVASLAYARIQGRTALVAHFQNSSLMNEDKRCRPILFHTDGPNVGGQEPFPMGDNIRSRHGRSRTANFEESSEGSPPSSAKEEGKHNGSRS